jgi:hypothetical protein
VASVAAVAAARREVPPPLPVATRPVAEPRTVSEPRTVPEPRHAVARPVATRAVPPPDVDDVPPMPGTRPARAAPVRVAPVRASRDGSQYDEAAEDQYDIPAFLRRGGQAKD